MKLYKCDLTIYVIAENDTDAKQVAQQNASDEHFTCWEVESVTKVEDNIWLDSYPYCRYPTYIEDLTCKEFLERNVNE